MESMYEVTSPNWINATKAHLLSLVEPISSIRAKQKTRAKVPIELTVTEIDASAFISLLSSHNRFTLYDIQDLIDAGKFPKKARRLIVEYVIESAREFGFGLEMRLEHGVIPKPKDTNVLRKNISTKRNTIRCFYPIE